MSETFNLETYLTGGISSIISSIIRATLHNPKESLYMTQYAISAKKAALKRADRANKDEHIPPFLIASITSSCNLHCKGCYARENKACTDTAACNQMTAAEWSTVFEEAADLGVSFILLAGGEPFTRYDVIETAGNVRSILFPIFTNGMMMDEKYMKLLDRCRNLLPVISIEGDARMTDARRGDGIYRQLIGTMNTLTQNGILFGTSVTVTTENLAAVISETFLNNLAEKGCKAVIYVEYVPADIKSAALAIGDTEREQISEKLGYLREQYPEMLFISFPSDEKSSGGCLAAGRGFFQINSHGGAEPCPFSPYSDVNVKEYGLRGAIRSRLFSALQNGELLTGDHSGGCVLFEKRRQVEELLPAK